MFNENWNYRKWKSFKKNSIYFKKKKLKYIIYKPNKPKYFDISKLNELNKCKALFIISPNDTHFYYLKKFFPKKYIFCEKPPVTNLKDLKKISKMNNGKVYFNFNLRFSKIAKILQNKDIYKMGNLLYANLILSHGLALKHAYKENWRSNVKKCPKGIFEIVSIHFIDLINLIFDIKKLGKTNLFNLSKIGTSYDTAHTEMQLKNKAIANIYVTYKSAYTKKNFFLFDNGLIEQNNGQILVKGPAKNLDKKGFFKNPKTIRRFKISDNKDYIESLNESINFFLSHAKNDKKIDKKMFNLSIKTNEFLLK